MDTTTTTTKIDKYASYESKIEAQKAELKAKDKRIADLERQNKLLRAVAEAAKEYWFHKDIIDEHNGKSGKFFDWDRASNDDWENEKKTRKALQAAIDGGALAEGE